MRRELKALAIAIGYVETARRIYQRERARGDPLSYVWSEPCIKTTYGVPTVHIGAGQIGVDINENGAVVCETVPLCPTAGDYDPLCDVVHDVFQEVRGRDGRGFADALFDRINADGAPARAPQKTYTVD